MAYLFKLDIDFKKAETGFVNIAKATGIASKNTLNTLAFLTRKNYIRNAENNLILRNTFTPRQIQVDRTDYIKIKRQVTRVGATEKADYMELQEKSGIKTSKSGKNLAIPQIAARGGSKRRLVRKSNYLRKIQRETVRWPRRIKKKKSRIVVTAKKAKEKNQFMNYKNNIYLITSVNEVNGKIRFTKRHIYHTGQKRTRIKAVPMLKPATKQPIRDAQNIFNSQIRKLLRQKKII